MQKLYEYMRVFISDKNKGKEKVLKGLRDWEFVLKEDGERDVIDGFFLMKKELPTHIIDKEQEDDFGDVVL